MRKRQLAFFALSVLLSLVALRSPISAEVGDSVGADLVASNGCTTTRPEIHIGDFNADGRSDLGIYWSDDNSFYVSLSDGASFDAPGSGIWDAANAFGPQSGRYLIGDFDGDRKSDLGFFYHGNNSFHVSTSTGTRFGGEGSGQWIAPGAFGHRDGRFYVAYFNGGLKADLGFFDPTNSSYWVSLSTGSAFNAPHSGQWIAPGEFGHAGGDYYIGDYTMDGTEDLGFFEPTDNSFYISMSNGEAFDQEGSGQWVAPGTFGHSNGRYYVGDYNGDGRADLGFFDRGNSSFQVNLSTGSSFGKPGSGQWIAPNTFGHPEGQYFVGNFDGDAGGKSDLAFFEPSDNTFHVQLSSGTGFGATGSGRWADLNLCRLYLPVAFDRQS